MFRPLITSAAVAWALALGITTSALAQSTPDEGAKAKQEAKAAGQDAGDAAKHVGKATKHAAKKTGHIAADAAKETAAGTKKTATTIKRAFTPATTSTPCEDGTVQTGKTKTTACIDHGGVRH